MINQQLKRLFKATTLALAITSSASVFAATSDEVVAIVGDSAILRSDLDQMASTVAQQLQKENKPVPTASTLRKQALDNIILHQAQIEMVKKYNAKPSEAELDQGVAEYAQQNGFNSLEQFKSYISSQSPNAYEMVRARVGQEVALSAIRQQQVMSRIKITDQDVTNFLNTPQGQALTGAQARALHVRISGNNPDLAQIANQVKNELTTTNDIALIRQKYSKNGVVIDAEDMGYRKLASIPAELAARLSTIQPNQTTDLIEGQDGIHILKLLDRKTDVEKMIVPQYQVRHILIQPSQVLTPEQAQQKINKIYQRLQSGDDFAQLASTYSNDPGSAADGGNLGWVSPGSMVPVFEEQMKAAKVGQISKPFQSQFGWHILEVLNTRQQDMTKEAQERLARQFLGEQQFNTEVENWLSDLKANTYVDIKDPSLK